MCMCVFGWGVVVGVGGVCDGRPHGEGLLSLSLSAHLTAAAAGQPKARPQARASCGPPAGFTSLPEPIRAPLLSTSAQEAPTQPCSPLPLDAIALCPALLRAEITLLFSPVCHVVSVISAVWGHVFYFYLFLCLCLPCPQAARFQIRLLRDSGFPVAWEYFLGTNRSQAVFQLLH